jgi:adenosylcobinamide-GDP ribazoletransferase
MFNQPHIRAFLFSIQFLSRIPIPAISAPNADDQSRAALYYPVVGLLIGLLMVCIVILLASSEPLLVSAIVVVFWAIITGALHIDGLADSADAWLGGAGDVNKTHAILKDPLLGTAGATAIVCILLIKYSALLALIKQDNYAIIMLAPVIGRAMILLLFCSTDYVRKQGLASAVIKGLNSRVALIGLTITLLIAAWFSLPGVIAVLLVFLALRNIMIKRLGGCTGDTAGATVEITEASWLLAAALV